MLNREKNITTGLSLYASTVTAQYSEVSKNAMIVDNVSASTIGEGSTLVVENTAVDNYISSTNSNDPYYEYAQKDILGDSSICSQAMGDIFDY